MRIFRLNIGISPLLAPTWTDHSGNLLYKYHGDHSTLKTLKTTLRRNIEIQGLEKLENDLERNSKDLEKNFIKNSRVT